MEEKIISGKLKKYGQYRSDTFLKLNFPFQAGKKLLDVGCGNGADSEILIQEYKLNVTGADVYENENIKGIRNLKFSTAGVYKLPFPDKSFDYVFLHDVLHHIDEKNQSYNNHIKALKELKRVCKNKGFIIIVEGNRYNPLLYPHIVLWRGHNHWRQGYFKRVLKDVFKDVTFSYFEIHQYPRVLMWFCKIYERVMEKFSPRAFLAYNIAIIRA